MWLGLALIVWLWGLALYLAAFYCAVLVWDANELHALLGQDFYNAHIPTGGWRAALVPTLVFLVTLALVAAAQRPLAALAGWLERRARVPQRAGRTACSLALVALAAPGVSTAVAAAEDAIEQSNRRAVFEQAERLWLEARAHDPFYTGAGLVGPVTSFAASGQRLHLDSQGTYRFSYSSWCGSCPAGRIEGRYGREADAFTLEPLPLDDEPRRVLNEVRWGDRVYLIGDDHWRLFVDAVNAGWEPRTVEAGAFLLRIGDEHKAAGATPDLPAPWAGALFERPLQGRTVAVADDGTTWLDLGERHGLRIGSRLFAADAPIPAAYVKNYGGRETVTQTLEIVEVERDRSRAQSVTGPAWAVPAGLVVTSREPARPALCLGF